MHKIILRTAYTTRYSAVSQVVYRTVPVCCAGYTGDGQTCTREWTAKEMWYNFKVGKNPYIAVCSPGCVNGRCSSPGVCSCNTGWTGPTCNQGVYIFSFLEQPLKVMWLKIPALCSPECGDNGMCTRPNYCSCSAGWGGTTCNTRKIGEQHTPPYWSTTYVLTDSWYSRCYAYLN